MLVSVIIPTCNKPKYLNITLSSLYSQKEIEKNFEIIVVNDGEDDYTNKIIEFWKKYLNIHTYKTVDNKGRASARNLGAKKAKGKILIFLDDDIVVMPNLIHEHLKFHKNSDHNVVIGYRYRLDKPPIELFNLLHPLSIVSNVKNIKNFPCLKDERESIYKKYNNDINNSTVPWICLFSNNFSIERSIFLENEGFDEIFQKKWGVEDVEFGYRLHKKNIKFRLAKKAKSYHLPHKISWKNNLKDLHTNLQIFFEKHNTSEIELYTNHLRIGILQYIDCIESINKKLLSPQYDIEEYQSINKYLINNISGKTFITGIKDINILNTLNSKKGCSINNIDCHKDLFGTKTLYQDNYFDTVIIGDYSTLNIPQYFSILIQEAYRISKKILFVLKEKYVSNLSKFFKLNLNISQDYKQFLSFIGINENEICINKSKGIYFIKIIKKQNTFSNQSLNISFTMDLNRPNTKNLSVIEMAMALSKQGANIHINNMEKFISYEDIAGDKKQKIKYINYLSKQEKIELSKLINNNIKLFRENFYEIPIIALMNETPKVIGWSEDTFMNFCSEETIRFINEELEMIWFFSEYAQKSFIRYGGDINKSYIVPYGVNPDLYKPNYNNDRYGKKFKFMAITSVFEEEGIDVILDSFAKEFYSNEKVELLIYIEPIEKKYNKGFFEETLNYKNYLKSLKQYELLYNAKLAYYKNKYSKCKNIKIKIANYNDRKRIFYYQNCDVYLHMYKKDFSGLNILKAMSCAKTTIVIDKFLPKGLCNKKNCFVIPSKISPAKESIYPFLANPDINELKKVMQFIYKNKEMTKIVGIEARKHILKKWTWQHIAEKAIKNFESIKKEKTNVNETNNLYKDLIKFNLTGL